MATKTKKVDLTVFSFLFIIIIFFLSPDTIGEKKKKALKNVLELKKNCFFFFWKKHDWESIVGCGWSLTLQTHKMILISHKTSVCHDRYFSFHNSALIQAYVYLLLFFLQFICPAYWLHTVACACTDKHKIMQLFGLIHLKKGEIRCFSFLIRYSGSFVAPHWTLKNEVSCT